MKQFYCGKRLVCLIENASNQGRLRARPFAKARGNFGASINPSSSDHPAHVLKDSGDRPDPNWRQRVRHLFTQSPSEHHHVEHLRSPMRNYLCPLRILIVPDLHFYRYVLFLPSISQIQKAWYYHWFVNSREMLIVEIVKSCAYNKKVISNNE